MTTPDQLARETAWPVDHWRNVENLLDAGWPRLINTVVALSATGIHPYTAASMLLAASSAR